MSDRERKSIDPGDVRALFRDAACGSEDRTERLLARVPAVVGEARRRGTRMPTVSEALMPLARRWLPALAAASALLAAIAIVSGPVGTVDGTVVDEGVERLVLIGSLGENGTDDVLLRAIIGTDGTDASDRTEVER